MVHLLKFHRRPAIVLIAGDRQVVFAHVFGGGGLAFCLTDLLVGVHLPEILEMVSENPFRATQVARTVLCLFKRDHIVAVAIFAHMHKSRVAAARHGFEDISFDVVMEDPEVAPHLARNSCLFRWSDSS